MVGTYLIPGWCHLVETSLLRMLRRRYPRLAKRLVSYYIPSEQKFVVGQWLSRAGGVIQDFFTYQHEMEVSPNDLCCMLYWNHPMHEQRLRTWLNRQKYTDREALHAQRDERRQRGSYIDFLKRHRQQLPEPLWALLPSWVLRLKVARYKCQPR